MAKYNRYDYDQMVMLPICLENQLASGTLEFAIHTLVETRMDLSVFDAKYKNDEMGSLSQDSFIDCLACLLQRIQGNSPFIQMTFPTDSDEIQTSTPIE